MSVNATSGGPGEWLREPNPCARPLHVQGVSHVSKIAINPFPSPTPGAFSVFISTRNKQKYEPPRPIIGYYDFPWAHSVWGVVRP